MYSCVRFTRGGRRDFSSQSICQLDLLLSVKIQLISTEYIGRCEGTTLVCLFLSSFVVYRFSSKVLTTPNFCLFVSNWSHFPEPDASKLRASSITYIYKERSYIYINIVRVNWSYTVRVSSVSHDEPISCNCLPSK